MFVPVSGAFGMGEYARSLSIARAARQRWPESIIHFVLSRQAPYAAATPFESTLLDSSATFHSAAVAALIHSFKPHVVIFDNAGRTAQLRAAHRSRARIVYISSRARQRRKAFRWRWMRLIDEHWIAYPKLIAGGLGFLERFKLNLLHRPVVRYLDVILSRSDSARGFLTELGLTADSYALIVPGGGTGHPHAANATAIFLQAANTLAESGIPAVFVGPPVDTVSAPRLNVRLRRFDSLPQAELAAMMSGARMVVTNGGSTLLQAIACGRACVAVAIAQDQPRRIQRCVAAGAAAGAQLDASSIAQKTEELWRDESARAGLARRATDLQLTDGVGIALSALASLLQTF